MIVDPFFSLCAIPAVLIFGLAKGGSAETNYIKSLPYFWLGQLNVGNSWASLLPLTPIGVGIGYYLYYKVSPERFYGIVNASLMVTGLKPFYDGMM